MEHVLSFLRELHDNNNREWFLAHKKEYLEAREIFNAFAMDLVARIRGYDDTIGDLSLNDVTYRIYRDLRFSKDKLPYKCHMGVFICRGGKKSGYCGYYFHISAENNNSWETGHIIAAGDYMTETKVLKILKEDIEFGEGDFRNILAKADNRLTLDMSGALKNVPAGFPAGTPDSDFYRLRRFCLQFEPDDSFVTSPLLAERLADIFRTAKPFVDYVNRAIEYAKEEI